MKCPKCSYLGFETGDRCKNCGYDFSLLAVGPAAPPDADLMIPTGDSAAVAPDLWLDRLNRSMDDVTEPAKPDYVPGLPTRPGAPPASLAGPPLPLFSPDESDDAPLIGVPLAPRPPLAVRRTPEAPRLRAVPKEAVAFEPALDFRGEIGEAGDQLPAPHPDPPPVPPRPAVRVEGRHKVGARRLAAAVIDHGILFSIDLSVVYFTLRMAGLEAGAITALPPAPMVTFLLLLKFTYFAAFTAVGGQTIGKMALGIRVVAEHRDLDWALAVRRTCAGLLSLLTLGVGFLPGFFGADRRTLHDRLTHTRVIGLPSE